MHDNVGWILVQIVNMGSAAGIHVLDIHKIIKICTKSECRNRQHQVHIGYPFQKSPFIRYKHAYQAIMWLI